MVTIGGIATFLMLFIVVIAGLHFRFVQKEQVLKPHPLYNAALLISCLAIAMVGIYGVIKLF